MYALKETATSIPYDSVAQSLEVANTTSDATDRSDPAQNAALAWEILKRAADINFYTPKTQPDILVEASSAGGKEHYILKEPKRGLYLQISPEDYYVYSLMDGNRTVVDLVVSYCMKYKVIAQTRVINFVQNLRGYGLLAEEFYDVYDTISLKLARRTFKYWTDQLLQIFITRRQIAISGIDRAVGALYRWLGWIFFTRPVLLLMLMVTFLGVTGFATLAVSGQYSVLGNQESVAAGLATLGVLQIVSIFLHECAHALTLKHFKREVRRAGLLFYLGLLGAFVDTTDIWYEGKWKRLAVTAAGPFMNLFLGGASVFLILARPNDALNGIIYQFALAQYLMVAFNAAPFIKLDGYYLLTDLFGISSLRERALRFPSE